MKRGENKKELKDTGRGSFGMHAAEGDGKEEGARGGKGEMMKRVNSDAISNKMTEMVDEVVEDDATATIRDTIPYSLRSGKKKRAGKRKKDQDEEDDEETREMRTKRVNIRALHNQLKRAASLDLVIMLDTTGSMQKYLTDIQTHIMSLVTAVGNLHPDSSLRLAFVGYHHVQDGRQVAQKFTSDLSVFSSVLKHVNVSGGGFDDYLADVTGGLKTVAELDWQSTTRILFHIGDMPCHGLKYHCAQLHDFYPRGDPNGILVEDTLSALYNAKVEYFFGKLTHHTDEMIEVFNDHFNDLLEGSSISSEESTAESNLVVDEVDPGEDLCNSKASIDQDYDENEDDDTFSEEFGNFEARDINYVKVVDINDPSLLISIMTGKVTESMTASLTTSYSTHLSAEGELNSLFGSLNLKTPQWQQLASERGQFCDIPFPESLNELFVDPAELLQTLHNTKDVEFSTNKDSVPLGHVLRTDAAGCQVKLGTAPFARGACRDAYKARVTSIPSLRRLRSDHGKMTLQRYDLTGIVKLPCISATTRTPPSSMKQQGRLSFGHAQALKQQHSYTVASFLAKDFNNVLLNSSDTERYQQLAPIPKIVYNPVTLLSLPSRPEPQQFATVELDITYPRNSSEFSAFQAKTFFESAQVLHDTHMPSTPAVDPGQPTRDNCKVATRTTKFEKYNGNHGLCVPNPTPLGTDHAVVQAFSHWTHAVSDGALLVIDCQGVYHIGVENDGGMFLLTDPAIHSIDVMKFGGTNLGDEGINRFFQTHQCNVYCAMLGLC